MSIALSACSTTQPVNTAANTVNAGQLPRLGQRYGTTDRDLSAFKWSNTNNTQSPNLYQLSLTNVPGTVMLQVTYAKTPDGRRRVSDVEFYKPEMSTHAAMSSRTLQALRHSYIPGGSLRLRLSTIGGNIRDMFSQADSSSTGKTLTSFYQSDAVAKRETSFRVKPCSADSGERGLVIVSTIENTKGGVDEMFITDAAVHYCGKLI